MKCDTTEKIREIEFALEILIATLTQITNIDFICIIKKFNLIFNLSDSVSEISKFEK